VLCYLCQNSFRASSSEPAPCNISSCCCAAVEFDGDRGLKELTAFVKEHAKIPHELKIKEDDAGDTEEKQDENKDTAEADKKTEL
jgi:hypothetical protein